MIAAKKILLAIIILCPVIAKASILDYFNTSGYIDTSYNHLQNSNKFTSGVNNRLFDLAEDGFTLQQFGMTITRTPSYGWGGLLTFMAGRDANSEAPYGWNPYFGSQTLAITPVNTYLQYVFGRFTLQAGLADTLIGAEYFASANDTNFSRSILDGYAEPGVLMGVRGLYAANNALKFILGVNNGWSGLRYSGHPSIEYGLTYTVTPRTSFMLQGLVGEQRYLNRISTGPFSWRNMLNFVGSYQLTNKLTLRGSYDLGIQRKALLPTATIGQALWQGVAGYVNYQYNDEWQSSLRGEWYQDRNGFTTKVRQNWREVTLTFGYKPWQPLILRAETRHDFSNNTAFKTTNGGASHNQQSYAIEAIYLF